MKQESIEEAAEKYVDNFEYGIAHPRRVCKNAFIKGAKWQQERNYSEKNMEEYADFCSDIVLREQIGYPVPTPKQWFEQFKKENNGKI